MGRNRKRATYILLTLAFLAGAAGSALRLEALHHSQLRIAHVIDFEATVESDPVIGKSRVVGSHIKSPSTSFLATLTKGVIDGRSYSLHIPVRISSTRIVRYLPSTTISGTGTIFSTQERKVAALISARNSLVQIAPSNSLNQIAGDIRSSFRREAVRVGGASGALIPGLVLGDTSLESEGFISDMRRAGLTHLTAVSGENFAIIASFLLWLLQYFFRKLRTRIVITTLILLAFIFLVRPSPSVLRASVMTAALLYGRAKGESHSALPALGLAIGLLVLADPFQSIDPGFALSVCATAGILLLAPALTHRFESLIRSEKLAELVAIPAAATIFCTPLIIAISGQLSLVSLPANFLASEVVGPITIVGLVAALLSPIFGGSAHLILLVCKPFAGWIVFVAHWLGSMPLLKIPKGYIGGVLALCSVILLGLRRWKVFIALVVLILVVHLATTPSWPGRDWLVANCDVGQGDGAAINLGQGSAIVIDAGPDPALMDTCLKDLGITSIPLLVLSHFHADHVNGLSGVLSQRTIGKVWVTSYQEPVYEYQQTMQLLHGRSVDVVRQGERFQIQSVNGPVDLQVLWPNDSFISMPSLPGDGSGINNSSIALLVTIGRFSFFTSGDTEPPSQAEILASGMVHHVDLIKVSHHGSAYQDFDLIYALRPRAAIISVGKGNPYGHPASSTIQALVSRGIQVIRTDVDGAIAVGSDLRISTKKASWWEISWA